VSLPARATIDLMRYWTHIDTGSKKVLAQQMSELMFDLLEDCQPEIERTAESLQLTLSEFKLDHSMRDDRMLRAGELARRMRLLGSGVTLVDGLVRKRTARGEPNVIARRAVEATLTAEGQKVQRELEIACLRPDQDIVDVLPAEAYG